MPRLVKIGLVVLEKRIFFNFINVFSLFRNLPFKKDGDLHLYKLEAPLPKVALIVPSLVEIGPVVLEKKIFKFVAVFSLFRNYLSLEKAVIFHFYKEFPFVLRFV